MATYNPILGCLAYILSPSGKDVLMVHRNARPDDDQLGKYNGLGGKMESSESISNCIRREIMEEAGLEILRMELRGTINWTNFGPKGEDWLGFIFLIHEFKGAPPESNEEGTLHWHPVDKLEELPMWDGDRLFLPLVFDGDPRPFHGHMPYEGGNATGWEWSRDG